MTPSAVRYVAPTGQTVVQGDASHCMHRRGTKRTSVTADPAIDLGAGAASKPLMPPSGESTWTTPSAVVVCRSTQVRVYSGSSGMSFSSLQATTHSPQPMQLFVSTTKPHWWAVAS